MIPKIYFPSVYEFPDFKINWYNMILQTETGQTQDNRHIYGCSIWTLSPVLRSEQVSTQPGLVLLIIKVFPLKP